jgi:hypothetical protein
MSVRHCCLREQYDLVERMLQCPRSDESIRTFIDIQIAVQQMNVKLFKELVTLSEIDLSVYGSWLVAVVAHFGGIECAKIILNCPSIDPSVNNQAYFEDACAKGYVDIVKEFLKSPKIDPSKFEFRALENAYTLGQHQVLQLLKQDQRCFMWNEPEEEVCPNCDENPCMCSQDSDAGFFPPFPGPPQCIQQ